MEDQKRDPGRRATEATVKFVAVLSVYVNTRMLQNGAHRTVMGRPNDAGRSFRVAREDAELAGGRFTADQIQNTLVFARLQATACDEVLSG
ncbi:hypothetical protein [Rhizobium leguminosarum]|uniref:hypothetical protein n=1 Tax=Rhizobium leguminosarum TaxID=384 RepID=UPI0019D41BF0|nr:hypothetical protein [Rhizobium leguminosarum]